MSRLCTYHKACLFGHTLLHRRFRHSGPVLAAQNRDTSRVALILEWVVICRVPFSEPFIVLLFSTRLISFSFVWCLVKRMA